MLGKCKNCAFWDEGIRIGKDHATAFKVEATADEMRWVVSGDKICSLIFSAFGVPSMMLGDEERKSSE